jgi:hypothetical protein
MMKFSITTRFTIVAVLLALGPFHVSAQNAGLELYAADSAKFYLILNGQGQNDEPASYLKNNKLEATRYKVKVVFDDDQGQEFSGNITLNKGKMITYGLKVKSTDENGNRTYGIALVSDISLAGFASTTEPEEETPNVGQSGNTTLEVTNTLTQDSVQVAMFDSAAVANYQGITGCSGPLSSTPFDAILYDIGNKRFESDKLDDAKKRIKKHCLTVIQVGQIMDYFEFEDNKLDFAKYAYAYTFDVGNYQTLADDFIFSTSKSDFERFLKARR